MTLSKAKAIVLDSWAVMAFFEDEPAGSQVADIIADANESGTPLLMSIVNAGEVWYIVARQTSEAEADKSIAELKDMGIAFVDVDWRLTRDAASVKSRNKMSFADCFAAALAKSHKAVLVTGDPEFRQVEQEIKVVWI